MAIKHISKQKSPKKGTHTTSVSKQKTADIPLDNNLDDGDLSTNPSYSDDDLSDNDGDWLDKKQEKAITKVLLATAKRKSPDDINKLAVKLAKVNRYIHEPEINHIIKPQNKVVLKDLELARLKDKDTFQNEAAETTQNHIKTNKDAQDTSSALKLLQNMDDEITESYAVVDENISDNQTQPVSDNQTTTSQSETSQSWTKYFEEVDSLRGLTNEDKFLKAYFVKEMWKGSSDPKVTIKDVDLSVNDAIDEAELAKSDHFEAEHNFRYERGGTRTQIIGHARLDDAFKPIKTLGKRARQRLNKKARKLAEIEAEKEVMGVASGPDVPIDKLNGDSDEDFPSDQEWYLCDSCNTAIDGGKVRYDCNEPDCDFCLCKNCQKKVKHEHPLRRVKTPPECRPPKSWPLAVAANKNIDMAEQITKSVLKSIQYKIDDGFKYIECSPRDFGLTDADLLTIDESKLNALAPPTCLEPYEDPAKVNYLYDKGLRKVKEFKKRSDQTKVT